MQLGIILYVANSNWQKPLNVLEKVNKNASKDFFDCSAYNNTQGLLVLCIFSHQCLVLFSQWLKYKTRR